MKATLPNRPASNPSKWRWAVMAVVVACFACLPMARASEPSAPIISYYISYGDNYEDGCKLYAVIDGVDVFVADMDDIFDDEIIDEMQVFAQEDFDGDGKIEALIAGATTGSDIQVYWAFVTNTGGKRFTFDFFHTTVFERAVLSTVNGREVVDFTVQDLGQTVVRNRFGLKNGKAVKLSTPPANLPSYTVLKTYNMCDMQTGKIYLFDFDDDGKRDKLMTSGCSHFDRNLVMIVKGKKVTFDVDAFYGCGELHVLKSKTKGMHDLMVENDTRKIYIWDGNTYVAK